MKAVLFEKYCLPEDLKLSEVPKPIPGTDEVLVEIHASTINSWDRELLRAVPFAKRMMFCLFKPELIKGVSTL